MRKRIIATLSLIPALYMTSPIITDSFKNKQFIGERQYAQQMQDSSFSESNLDFEEFIKNTKQIKIEKELQKIREEAKQRLLEEERKKQELAKVIPLDVVNKTLSRGGYIQEYNLRVSFYTVSYEETGKIDGITASGKKIQQGHIAMPREFSFETEVYIEGLGKYTVEDRGGAITIGKDGIIKVDVYIPNASKQQLLNLGVVYTKGYIIN